MAAVLAVTALAVLPGGGGDPAPPSQSPTPTSPGPSDTAPTIPAPEAVSAGKQYGAQVWWAPDKAEEAALPRLDVAGLPEEIDLSAGSPPHPPGVRASAMFAVGNADLADGRVVVLGTDGATYSLDVGRLDPVADEPGNRYLPFGEGSLSPDGRHAFFRQESSLEVYNLVTGEWTTIDTPDWLAEGARWFNATEIWVPQSLGATDGSGTVYDISGGARGTDQIAGHSLWKAGSGEAYGPLRLDRTDLSGRGPRVAQAQFPGVDLADPNGTLVSGADAVVTSETADGGPSVLVLPYSGGAQSGRWKGCCPVVGWLEGSGTLLFASRGSVGDDAGDSRVLAWKVGTPELFRVSQVTGWVPGQDFHVASYPDLGAG